MTKGKTGRSPEVTQILYSLVINFQTISPPPLLKTLIVAEKKLMLRTQPIRREFIQHRGADTLYTGSQLTNTSNTPFCKLPPQLTLANPAYRFCLIAGVIMLRFQQIGHKGSLRSGRNKRL